MASQEKDASAGQSTQNTQYDKIGTKYNAIKLLPATEPEVPSVKAALGDITGKTCLGTCIAATVPPPKTICTVLVCNKSLLSGGVFASQELCIFE